MQMVIFRATYDTVIFIYGFIYFQWLAHVVDIWYYFIGKETEAQVLSKLAKVTQVVNSRDGIKTN